MQPINVAIMWHMHQPSYREPGSQQLALPWVRLHAIKGYYDMIGVLRNAGEDVRAMFNFVPVLTEQLAGYTDGTVSDIYLELSRKPVEDLTAEERTFIVENFFHANRRTMIDVHERYRELRIKSRGPRDRVRDLSDDELRDLAVWFNLTWCGYTARHDYPELYELVKQQRGYSEDQKQRLLDIQTEIISCIVPRYREAEEAGLIELTTTPYYHPILPLICDTNSAKPGMPDRDLPDPPFSAQDDAREHIRRALDSHEHNFGKRPRGMWPAEGSVSPEVIELIAEAGIDWIATDQDVLLASDKSLKQSDVPYLYTAGQDDKTVTMAFRHLGVSNAIGFDYTNMDPDDGVADIMKRLNGIASHIEKPEEALISIILDGENAWEYYPDGGEQFLLAVCRTIADSERFQWATVSEHLDEHPPSRTLSKIFPGSWINANFDIWIGHPEENTGWEYLRDARHALVEAQDGLDDDKKAEAWQYLYIAEGSDWFWWFSDDFSTALQGEFDRLFRANLAAVYRTIGEPVPRALFTPIKKDRAIVGTAPTDTISPEIDGRITNYYEWIDAGQFDALKAHGAMAQGEQIVTGIFYGCDREHLYLRIDTSKKPRDKEFGKVAYTVVFENQDGLSLVIGPYRDGESAMPAHIRNESSDDDDNEGIKARANSVIECAVPLTHLGYDAGAIAECAVIVRRDENEIERWPRDGLLSIEIPSDAYELNHWSAWP